MRVCLPEIRAALFAYGFQALCEFACLKSVRHFCPLDTRSYLARLSWAQESLWRPAVCPYPARTEKLKIFKRTFKRKRHFLETRIFYSFWGSVDSARWGASFSAFQGRIGRQAHTTKDGKLISHLLGWLVGAQFDPQKLKMRSKVAQMRFNLCQEAAGSIDLVEDALPTRL